MAFIKLHNYQGTEVIINTTHVVKIVPDNGYQKSLRYGPSYVVEGPGDPEDKTTTLYFDNNTTFVVKEPYDEVKAILDSVGCDI